MNYDDFYSGSALGGGASGAASGAMLGSSIAPGYGTAIGGIVGGAAGLLGGAFANSKRDEATRGQQENLEMAQIMMRQQALKRRKEFLANLDKSLSFYGPAQQQWDKLYGSPGVAPQTGQGSWSNTGVK